MNLNQLQYFKILAQEEHYTRAAQMLSITQPSLSHAIAQLEEELGTRLFEKKGRNIVLTRYGKLFLPYVEESLKVLEEGVQRTRELNGSKEGIIHLAYIYTMGSNFTPKMVRNFLDAYPDYHIDFHFTVGTTGDILAGLKEDKYDIVFSSYQEGDRILFRLYNEEFSCIYEQDYACSRIAREHMLVATPDMDVDLEHLYYYEVIVPEEVSAVLEIAYADNSLLSQAENGILYIDGIINESSSLIADFRYSNNLSVVGMILCDLLIILCERYFPECRVFYPPDWLVVQADWPLHGWSVFFWLLFLTGITRYAFADAARRRIGYS